MQTGKAKGMPGLQLQKALLQLDAKDRGVREAAEQKFVQHPKEASVFLLRALKEKENLIGKIALLLAALNFREAVPVLLEICRSKKITEFQCAEIICALAELSDGQDAFNESFMEALNSLKSHPSALVRGLLVKVYAKVADLASIDCLHQLASDQDVFVRERAGLALLQIDAVLKPVEKDVQQLIEMLSHPNAVAQASAITALKKHGSPLAVMPLFAFIYSTKDEKLRAAALAALANCLTGAEQGLLEPILLLAKDLNPEIQAGALLCLGRLSDEKGKNLQPIIMGLLSLDKNVNAAAAIALSEGFREGHEHLLKFLVEIYRSSYLSSSSKEALLIAFSRVKITDAGLKDQLRYLIAHELKSNVLNIRKTAIVVLEALYDDAHPVPAEVVKSLRDLLFDKNKEIQIVSASFLRKHGLR